MKKVLLIVSSLLLCAGIFAQSGTKDYPLNETLKRSDLVKMEFQQQKAVFATLSPEVRCQLWKDKFADNLHSKALTDGEKAVLTFFYEMITPAAYDNSQKEMEGYIRKLAETSKTVLERYYDWPPSKVFRYLYTFMTEEEIEAYNATHQEQIR